MRRSTSFERSCDGTGGGGGGGGSGVSSTTVSRSEWIEGVVPLGVDTLTVIDTEGVDGVGESGGRITSGGS